MYIVFSCCALRGAGGAGEGSGACRGHGHGRGVLEYAVRLYREPTTVSRRVGVRVRT